jgi:hypothetical protein
MYASTKAVNAAGNSHGRLAVTTPPAISVARSAKIKAISRRILLNVTYDGINEPFV